MNLQRHGTLALVAGSAAGLGEVIAQAVAVAAGLSAPAGVAVVALRQAKSPYAAGHGPATDLTLQPRHNP